VTIADETPDYDAGAAILLSRIQDTGGLADFASLRASRTSTDASRAQELPVGREILDALARQQGFVTDPSSYDHIVLAREPLAELRLQARDQVVVPAAEVCSSPCSVRSTAPVSFPSSTVSP